MHRNLGNRVLFLVAFAVCKKLMCECRDKCSIKRSVLGAMCKLGSNVKIINSVLMDSVVVHDGCHLQNCIVCTGAQLQASILKLLPCPYYSLASSEAKVSRQLYTGSPGCTGTTLCLLECS